MLETRIKEDFQRLLTDTTRSFSTEIVYNHVWETEVNPVTGKIEKYIDEYSLLAIQTRYQMEETPLKFTFIEPGTIAFYVLKEAIEFIPHKDDYIIIGEIQYDIYKWQLDTDGNVYRFFTRTLS